MSNPFDPEATAQSVHHSLNSALSAIPDGKRGALLVIADTEGTRALLAARIGNNWQLAVGADKPWSEPVSGLITLHGSW